MSHFDELDDFLAIPRVTQLRLAPDGSRLVATVSGLSRDRKKFASALWEIDPHRDVAPRRLTLSAAGESSPQFLPDGGLLFLSKRRTDEGEEESDKDVTGLWSLPAAGGEARRIATRPGGFRELALAADAGTAVLRRSTRRASGPAASRSPGRCAGARRAGTGSGGPAPTSPRGTARARSSA